MSLVLSTMHENLFRNMLNMEATAIELVNKFAEKEKGQEFINNIDYLPKGELKSIIEADNIHNWLLNNLLKSEKTFANSIEFLLENEYASMDELIEIFYEKGREISDIKSPLELFKFLKSNCLDGMPCDGAIEVLDKKDGYLMWARSKDMHGMFWKDRGESFYKLRNAWILGICESNDIDIRINNNIYEVKLCTE